MARRGRKSGARARIQDVRITDSTAGSDGSKIDRMIQATQVSESQVRVICGDVFDINPPTTQSSTIYGFATVINTDDFQSLAQQYELYRVTAIKFDIYDINPSAVVSNVWSTFHNSTAGASGAYTRAQVADGPDSRVLSSGTGFTSLYWRAHGTLELGFQPTNTTGTTQQYFGGLRYSLAAATAGQSKYQVVVHAVVDFRGRL